jgi:O-antigen ligase
LAVDPVVALKASLRLTFLWFIFAVVNQLAAADDSRSAFERLELPIFASVALALGMALQGLIGVLQFVRQGSVGLAALGEMDLNPVESGTSVLQLAGQPWLRAYGLSAHPNVIGGYLAIGLLVLIGAMVLIRHIVPRAGWTWGVPLLAAGLAGLIVTFSRSAWVGGVGGLVYLGLALRPRKLPGRRLLAVAGIGALIVLLVFASVGELILSRLTPSSPVEQTSIEERLEFHALALQVIAERPLGVGGDNFPLVANQKLNDDRQARPHNVPLLVVAELGPVGGLLWLILALVPPAVAWRRARHDLPHGGLHDQSRRWALVFAAGLVAVSVISLFDHYFWSSVRGTMFWAMLLGLWSVALPDEER